MTDKKNINKIISELPPEAFQEDPKAFQKLTPIQRLHWLEETAQFVFKNKGKVQTLNKHNRK